MARGLLPETFASSGLNMYRYVRRTPLDTGHKYGDILRDGDLKPATIEAFLASGILVRISTPPLSEIPTFEKRCELLAQANIITVADLIKANPGQTAKKTKKSVSTIRRWQSEVMQWLMPDENIDEN